MKSTPVKGTADYLPRQTLLRDYLQSVILETYRCAGFERILTPAVEDIENLEKSDGGDNLNLMFKILKRGEKLDAALAAGSSDLCDLGLRYDLTLPLSRFYANNRTKLLSPFKCIQIDKAYRAERPQKGRMREFIQCDIDIVGSDSPLCELELIHTTAAALLKLQIGRFTVRVNDRKVLRGILRCAGVAEERMDTVCVTLDKWDKIGEDGVMDELAGKDIAPAVIEKLRAALGGGTLDSIKNFCSETEALERLERLIADAEGLAAGQYSVVYDPLLVRGQGYYTGTVFEIASDQYKGSVAGGGRYDGLVGKFTGEDIPAVGFSIGFERIFQILEEKGFEIPGQRRRVALLCSDAEGAAALKIADSLREAGFSAGLFPRPKKLGKFLGRLEEQGFDGYLVCGEGTEPKWFGGRA